MSISQFAINKYIESFDLETYLYNYGVDFEDRGHDFLLKHCPDCDKAKKCFVHKDKKFYHCYRCDTSSNLFGLMSAIENLPRKEIFKREVKNIETHINQDKHVEIADLHKFDLNKPLEDRSSAYSFKDAEFPMNFYKVNLADGSDQSNYLLGRGFTQDMVDEFNIHYSQAERRIVFPFYWNDRLVGWQGRDITGLSDLKALTKPDRFRKEHFLFGYSRLMRDVKFVTIVEGPVDLIKSRKYNPVALLGSSFGPYQLNLLLSLPNLKTIFMGLDPEEEEKKEKIYKVISPFFDVYDVVDLPDGCGDLGDCTEQQVGEALAKSEEYREVENVFLDKL